MSSMRGRAGRCGMRLLRVLAAERIQTSRPGAVSGRVGIRGGGAGTAAHESIRVIGRGLERVPVRAGLTVGAVPTWLALRPLLTCWPCGPRWSLRSCGTDDRRPVDTRSPGYSGLAWHPDAVTTRRADGSGLPRGTGRAGVSLGSGRARRSGLAAPRFAARSGRTGDWFPAEGLHLPRQRVAGFVRGVELTRQRHDLHRQPAEERHDEEHRECAEPLRARQPQRGALLADAGHETTAQIATAADSRASSTGTISW